MSRPVAALCGLAGFLAVVSVAWAWPPPGPQFPAQPPPQPKGLSGKPVVVFLDKDVPLTLEKSAVRRLGGRDFLVGTEVVSRYTKAQFPGSVVWVPPERVTHLVELEAPAGKQAPPAHGGDAAGHNSELTRLVKDLNQANVKADIAFLERVLHADFTHHRPRGTVENWAQYLENRKAGRVGFESLVAEDIKVRRYGDTAVVTYRSAAKGKDPQGAFDHQRLWTRVFVRRDGRWQLVHSQGTPIQKP
jgi:ketosteroid isomerase-like protein